MLTPGKGPNRVFQKSVSGGSVESVFSAAHQNAVAQNVERVNRVVYGPGADVLSLGPYAVRRQQGGGSSATIDLVLFELETVDCQNGTATATVLNYICDGEDNIGDTIDLVDDMGCYLVGPPELLVGVKGKAVKMAGAYDCEWTILSLCCGGFTC